MSHQLASNAGGRPAGLGLGVEDRNYLKILVDAGKTLILDTTDVGERVVQPLPASLVTAIVANGQQVGLTVRIEGSIHSRAGGIAEHPRRIRRRPRLRGGAGHAEPLAGPRRSPDRGLPPAVGSELCRATGLGPVAGPPERDVANYLIITAWVGWLIALRG